MPDLDDIARLVGRRTEEQIAAIKAVFDNFVRLTVRTRRPVWAQDWRHFWELFCHTQEYLRVAEMPGVDVITPRLFFPNMSVVPTLRRRHPAGIHAPQRGDHSPQGTCVSPLLLRRHMTTSTPLAARLLGDAVLFLIACLALVGAGLPIESGVAQAAALRFVAVTLARQSGAFLLWVRVPAPATVYVELATCAFVAAAAAQNAVHFGAADWVYAALAPVVVVWWVRARAPLAALH